MRIYFAGPLFTPYERSFIDQCAAKLRAAGIEVFVPHETPLPETNLAEFIFKIDAENVVGADAVLALLDGPMVDDGTANEIGIFWATMQHYPKKKGIVGLVTDSRVLRASSNIDGKGINLFVRGCIEDVGMIVETFDEALEILLRWKAELDSANA